MKVPINSVDNERFRRLAELIFEKSKAGEIHIYHHGSYVHLELYAPDLDPNDVQQIFRLDVAALLSPK